MRRQLLFVLVGMGLCSGCVVIVDDVSESGDSDASETQGDGDGDVTGDGDGDPAGDGDGDATGDGDGDDDSAGDGDGDVPGDGDGDATGDGDCEPVDGELALSYELSGFEGDFEMRDYSWSCTVTQVAFDQGLQLELDCPQAPGPVSLDISATPLPPALALEPGELLTFRHVYDGPFWFNFYLRLDRELGGHLLTLVDGDALLPPEPYEFAHPFALEAVSGLCSPSEEFCGQRERLALGFELDGESYELFDRTHALVGPPPGRDVWVSEAGRLSEISCTDTPPDWYRVLIISGA